MPYTYPCWDYSQTMLIKGAPGSCSPYPTDSHTAPMLRLFSSLQESVIKTQGLWHLIGPALPAELDMIRPRVFPVIKYSVSVFNVSVSRVSTNERWSYFYIWVSKVLANKGRRYLRNVFPHWPYAQHRKQVLILSNVLGFCEIARPGDWQSQTCITEKNPC